MNRSRWNRPPHVINAGPPGRISIGDVSKSVAYLATYAGQRKLLDVNYFKAVAAMKPSFLIRSEQIAGRLVTGEDLMAFSGMPTRAYQYNQKGGKLKLILPEEGSVLLPQSMFILAKAPHANAAKLWVDFVLSEQGQAILVQGEAMVSGRTGFKSPLPEYAPGIDSLKLINVDWQGLSSEKLKARSSGDDVFELGPVEPARQMTRARETRMDEFKRLLDGPGCGVQNGFNPTQLPSPGVGN